jgi:hypothetical protein
MDKINIATIMNRNGETVLELMFDEMSSTTMENDTFYSFYIDGKLVTSFWMRDRMILYDWG